MEIASVDMKAYLEPFILLIAILLGAVTGLNFSLDSNLVNYSIIAMLCCLFFNVSIEHLLKGVKMMMAKLYKKSWMSKKMKKSYRFYKNVKVYWV